MTTSHGPPRPSRPDRPHRRHHRRQQRHRPRRRHASWPAPAPTSCSPCATRQGRRGRRERSPATTEVRALDLADLASVRAFADGWEGDIDVLINNAGVMAPPRVAHRRRLRDADRHQPPRPLRAHEPAAAARSRDRVVTVASGAHRMGKIRLDDLNWEQRRLQVAGAPTASPSSPTCCSRASSSGAWPRRGSDVRAVAAHPGYAATNLQSHTGSGLQHVGHADRQQADRPERRAGRAGRRSTRRRQDIPGNSYVGPDGFQEGRGHPTLVGRSDAAQDADVARAAVGALRGADGRELPAGGRRRLTKIRPPCSSCAPPANAATATCRRSRPTRGSAPTSARSAPTASRGRWAGCARTAAATSSAGRSGRRPRSSSDPASTVRVYAPAVCQN